MIDVSRVDEGNAVIVDVEWREESVHDGWETVEMEFAGHDEEESEILVRHGDNRLYRIPDDCGERLVCLYASQHCTNCGQHYWPSHGFVHEVEFPEHVEGDQLTLGDID